MATVTYPDSGEVDYQYNRQGQRIEMADQNGSVHEYTYDKLGRQTADKVTTVGGTLYHQQADRRAFPCDPA